MPLRKLLTALLFAAVAYVPALSRTSVVAFPLQNQSGDDLVEWMRFVLPEVMSRTCYVLPGVQLWDPQFLFSIDSTGYDMESDSLLEVHRSRWKWDAAIGGAFTIKGDSAVIKIQIVATSAHAGSVKKHVTVRCSLSDVLQGYAKALPQVFDAIGIPSPEASVFRPLTSRSEAYATYVRGYGYEMQHRYANAISAYGRACELAPSLAMALCRAAKIYRMGGDAVRARDLYDKAVAISPGDPVIVAEAAGFALDIDGVAKAAKFFDSRRAVLETSATGLLVLGKMHYLNGEVQRAVAMLTRSVAFGPPDLEADFLLGSIYFATEQFDLASDYFNRLVQLRPDYLTYDAALGAVYRGAGRFTESARVLENAARRAPDDPAILTNLAHTYFCLTWYEKAYQLLDYVNERWPERDASELNLGVVEWHLGKHREAVKLFETAARSKAHRQESLANLGNMSYLQGQYRDAIRFYTEANRAGERNEMVLSNLAMAYLTLGKFKEAQAYLEEVAAMAPTRRDVLVKLQEIARKRGDEKGEEAYLRRLLSLSPGSEDALEAMARILRRQQRYEESVEYLETYLQRNPNSKRMILALADTYRARGWFDAAVMKYELLLDDYAQDSAVIGGLGRSLQGLVMNKNDVKNSVVVRALDMLTRSSALSPRDPGPERLLGDLYYRRGDAQQAEEHWNRALARSADAQQKGEFQAHIRRVRQGEAE